MKKLLLILSTIVLFLGTAQSAELLDVFRDYRYAIKQALGLDTNSTTYADTTLNQNVRLAQLHINPVAQLRQKELLFSRPISKIGML